MQDNAPVHTWRPTQAWLREQGWIVIEWPPYSPDLNPIEHVWKLLKAIVHCNHPELYKMTLAPEAIKDRIWEAVEEAWYELDESYLECLIKSMPNRVNAVIAAKGGYTRY